MRLTAHIISDDDKRARCQGSMQHCDCCGRAIKGAPRYWIELEAATETVIHVEDAPLDGRGSLGSFPIGPECAKKYPDGYVWDTTKQEAL